jgi:hypothetical protein
MRFILAICVFIVAIFSERCTICSCKQVPCPAFNDSDFAKWFPYAGGEILIFQNASAFDTINIGGVQKSSSYDANQGCSSGNNGCTASCTISTDDLSPAFVRKLQVTISTVTPFGSNQPTRQINLAFYELSCMANGLADTGLVEIHSIDSISHFTSNYYSSMNIGGHAFNSVQLIEMDTSSTSKYSGPYKIFLAKNAGIVAYETYPDVKLWTKQ